MSSINDRLTYDILVKLNEGNKRFRDLLPCAPKATLAIRLKLLENRGYIRRNVLSTRPITTEYNLTTLGRTFLDKINEQYVQIVTGENNRVKMTFPSIRT
jgi:DNA-binding HxlR family transcriptional regulator